MEVENLERVDDVQAVEAVELLVGGLADERVHVDGVDSLGVGMLLHHAADGAEHAVHRLAQVLAAVRVIRMRREPPPTRARDGSIPRARWCAGRRCPCCR